MPHRRENQDPLAAWDPGLRDERARLRRLQLGVGASRPMRSTCGHGSGVWASEQTASATRQQRDLRDRRAAVGTRGEARTTTTSSSASANAQAEKRLISTSGCERPAK